MVGTGEAAASPRIASAGRDGATMLHWAHQDLLAGSACSNTVGESALSTAPHTAQIPTEARTGKTLCDVVEGTTWPPLRRRQDHASICRNPLGGLGPNGGYLLRGSDDFADMRSQDVA